MPPPLHSEHTPITKLSPTDIETNNSRGTIGILSSEIDASPLLLSLKQIEAFVRKNIAVLIQRGLGVAHEISDYNFTEHGADIMEDELPIIALSNILLRYEAFSVEQIFFLKQKQVIISMVQPETFTKEMAQFLNEKKITAVGINLLNFDSSKIQETVNQLVSSFLFSHNILHSIQLNSLLLKNIYCYNGEICNRTIAEQAGVPWKDLVELCWNWN